MPEGFRIAAAWVSVSPDMEGFKEELRAKLDEAVAGVEAKARVTLDTSELDAKADEARARVDELDGALAEPSVRLDDAGLGARADEARAKLDELDSKSARPDIGLESSELDAAVDHARTKLDELDGKRTEPRLGLETADFDAKMDAAEARLAAFNARSADARLGGSGGGEGGSRASGGEGGGLLGAVTMGIGSLLPGVAGAGAGLGLLGGTAALGLGGITKALSSAHQASMNVGITPQQMAATQFGNQVAQQQAQIQISSAQQQAAQDAITSARSIEQAQMNLASVQRNSAEQQVQALQSVRQAEQGVEEANYSLSEAQYNLNQAWETAREQIRELNDQLADSRLNVQSAQLAIQQALYQQRLTDQNAYSTSLDRQQAALAVAEAQQRLVDAQDQLTDSQYKADLANKQGVEGSQQVIQAKQAVTQAQYGQVDAQAQYANAQRELTLTELNSAQQVKEAQMQVAAAEGQAAYQRMVDARNIADAQRNLTNTIRQQQLQMAATMSTSNEAANQFAKDMSRLSPAAQHVVEQILGMRDAFRQVGFAAQNAIAPGLSVFLTGLSSAMPGITAGVSKAGTAIGQAFAGIGGALQGKGAQEVLSGLVDNGIRFAQIVVPAFGRFVGELGLIGSQKGASDGLANLLAGFGRALTGLAASVGRYTPQINQFLTAVGNIIAQIGPPLGVIIGQVAQALEPLTRYLNAHPNGTVVKVLGDIVAGLLVMRTLKSAVTVPFEAITSGVDVIKGVPGKVQKVAEQVGGAFTKVFGPGGAWDTVRLGGMHAADGVRNALGKIADALPTSLDAKLLLKSIQDQGKKVGEAVAGWGSDIASASSGLWTGFKTNLVTLGESLAEAGGKAKQLGMDIATALIENGKSAWLGLVGGITAARDAMLALKDSEIIATTWAQITAGAQALLDAAMDANPIGIVVLALAALVAGLVYAYNHVGWFHTMVDGTFKLVGALASWLWHEVFEPVFRGIGEGASWLYQNAILPLWHGIEAAFHGIESVAGWLWHNVFEPLWQGIKLGAEGFIESFKLTWNLLQDVFKTPVNFLIDVVYTKGIEALWNGVVDSIGQNKLELPNIPHLAGGGVLPGYAPGQDTVPTMLSPGEGVLVPEAVQAIGPSTVLALNAAYSGGRVSTPGHFSGGGISGLVDTVLGKGGDLAKIIAAVATGNIGALTNALTAFVGTKGALAHYAEMMLGVPTTLIHDAVQAITSVFSSGGSKGGGASVPGNPSGTAAQWFAQAVQLAGVPASWIPALETIGYYESGDNPDAQNNWDSNAKNGDPSRGIMQTIMSTFLGNHQAGTSMNIFDPVANIAAAINYIRGRYGDVANVPGIKSLARGGSYVGYDSGGWLMPGNIPVNGLSRPEAVLTPDQSVWLRAMAENGVAAQRTANAEASKQVVINFTGTTYPNPEQLAALKREMGLALSGV